MLDKEDLETLDKLIASTVNGGFFCVVGSPELLPISLNELRERFENKRGISDGKVVDMGASKPHDIDDLLNILPPPPVVYFSDFADGPTWKRIKIRRDYFIKNKIIVIFFLDSSQYRETLKTHGAIGSLTTTTNYSLGAQRTLDNMGEEFLDGMKIFPADIGHFVELNAGSSRVWCGKDCREDAEVFFEHDGDTTPV